MIVRSEVLIELVELFVDPELFDRADDVLVALLVAHGASPLRPRSNAGAPPAICPPRCGSDASASAVAQERSVDGSRGSCGSASVGSRAQLSARIPVLSRNYCIRSEGPIC